MSYHVDRETNKLVTETILSDNRRMSIEYYVESGGRARYTVASLEVDSSRVEAMQQS